MKAVQLVVWLFKDAIETVLHLPFGSGAGVQLLEKARQTSVVEHDGVFPQRSEFGGVNDVLAKWELWAQQQRWIPCRKKPGQPGGQLVLDGKPKARSPLGAGTGNNNLSKCYWGIQLTGA